MARALLILCKPSLFIVLPDALTCFHNKTFTYINCAILTITTLPSNFFIICEKKDSNFSLNEIMFKSMVILVGDNRLKKMTIFTVWTFCECVCVRCRVDKKM